VVGVDGREPAGDRQADGEVAESKMPVPVCPIVTPKSAKLQNCTVGHEM